ncbi:RNA polymerase sigma factor [Paenibacillus lemnae]|uniref:RNA polymerase sigma factor n=1 Tax=Paenibacillus lemnae TaxID=1330551 RepID=A0A848M625_PAELE|nr:RNA polymerase sigma factor [Paenibacillus lemnae]NMO95552.1 RNA polymerase sigma factor [Paenibacillus lemnae]
MNEKNVQMMETQDITALMKTYGEAVWNYAYFLSRNHAAADDIAQETFIRAYKYMNNYRGEASVKTWLLRIARNRWYSFRSTSFVKRVVHKPEAISGMTAQSAEDEALEQSLSTDVWKLVYQLPLKDREVLILAIHYELTMEELAGTLGISLSAAKSRLQRARQRAKARWEGADQS